MDTAGTQGPSQDTESLEGIVIEALPNTLFKVQLQEGDEILAYLAGKMRLHRIRVLVGDRVLVTPDPYGGKGRITRRLQGYESSQRFSTK